MLVQVIHGVQKYNLELPDSKSSTTTGQKQEFEEKKDVDGEQTTTVENSTDWTIKKLKEEIEKLTGIPVEGQRLIRKGSTLFGDDTLISTLNFNPGEKIMVLGQRPEMPENPALKSLDTVERTILEGIENKMKEIDERLEGIRQGYLTKELVTPALNDLEKQLKVLAEDCMKTLELMDAMRLGEDVQDKARTKRKFLVGRVQSLLRWHDELMDQLRELTSDIKSKDGVSIVRVQWNA